MSFGFGFGFPKNYVAALFSPAQLFTTGVNGAWYDPSDINLTWRRNLLIYSEQFDNAAWGKVSITVTPNSTTAPDGTVTADLLNEGVGTAAHYIIQTPTPHTAGTTYTISVYVKSGTVQWIQIPLSSSSFGLNAWANFDIVNGVVGNIGSAATASIQSAGEEWYRCIITAVATATGNSAVFQLAFCGNTNTASRLPSTTGADLNCYIWGAQAELGNTATPYQRITDGVQDYLQYQAQPVLYQDAAGTTPVTAVEQPAGLMLDKSKGLVLGPELVTNGTFDININGWSVFGDPTSTIGWNAGRLEINAVTAFDGASQTISGLTVGKFYDVSVTFQLGTATALQARLNPATAVASSGTSGVIRQIVQATSTSQQLQVTTGSVAGTAYFDNISVRELPGNHAFNSSGNSANFPVLSARYNLLTKTEDCADGSVWTRYSGGTATTTVVNNYGMAPDGTNTAALFTFTAGGNSLVTQNLTVPLSVGVTISLWMKGVTGGEQVRIDLRNNLSQGVSGPQITLTADWVKYVIPITNDALSTARGLQFRSNQSDDGKGSFLVWHPDLRVSNDALNQPAYQRVNTPTDYDTVGFKPYLSFNGVNQWLQTNSIDFSYGDKMFVCAGVRKLSDAAAANLLELSSVFTNPGAFAVFAPTSASARYGFISNGTASSLANTTPSYVAPITNVVSGIGDISGDQAILRANGSQVAISTADQGTGNYGNYPLYIGARAGSSLWFNGRLYGLVVADGGYNQYALENDDLFLLEDGTAMLTEYGANPGPTVIAAVESYMNQKTGAY